MSESQAGSKLPSGEEDRATEITSKPGVTGLQMLLVDYIYRDEPQCIHLLLRQINKTHEELSTTMYTNS